MTDPNPDRSEPMTDTEGTESGAQGRRGATETASGCPSDPPDVTAAHSGDLRGRVARALWDHDHHDHSPEWREMAWDDMGGSEPFAERVRYEMQADAVLAVLPSPDGVWTCGHCGRAGVAHAPRMPFEDCVYEPVWKPVLPSPEGPPPMPTDAGWMQRAVAAWDDSADLGDPTETDVLEARLARVIFEMFRPVPSPDGLLRERVQDLADDWEQAAQPVRARHGQTVLDRVYQAHADDLRALLDSEGGQDRG